MDNVLSPFMLVKLKDMANGAGFLSRSKPLWLLMAINPGIRVGGTKLSLWSVKTRVVDFFFDNAPENLVIYLGAIYRPSLHKGRFPTKGG